MRTADQAITWLKQQEKSGTYRWDGQCKALARTAYGIPSDGTPSALLAWEKTDHRGKGSPPRGAFVWWTNQPNGHVGIADGNGNIIANVDWKPADGRVRTLPIDTVSAVLGRDPVGWSRDIEGVSVIPEPEPRGTPQPARSGPDFKVVNIRATPDGDGTYPGVVGDLLELCGWDRGRSGAKSLQRYLGRPATGRLGRQELTWLAQRFNLDTKG